MWGLDTIESPRIVLHPDVLKDLEDHRQTGDLLERGGLLLGEIHANASTLFVSQVSVPGPEDRSSRFSWNRNQGRANRIILECWERSGGIINYLGEWHTHPQDIPLASFVDKATMFRLVRRTTLVTPGLLMFIVGRERVVAEYWTRSGFCQVEFEVMDII